MDLSKEFPIESQTSLNDKVVLLKIRDILQRNPSYNYLEIGSFLGGSLTPFLQDEKCERVLSIDERGRAQPDERGALYDYAGITHQTMIDNLHGVGLNTQKLTTFDGSIDDFTEVAEKYDFAFIDGEHTDFACFRDFIHCERLLKQDHIVAFHDSTFIYKSLKIIIELLKAKEHTFKFIKVIDAEVSVILSGSYCDLDESQYFAAEPDLEDFFRRSEDKLLMLAIQHRIDFNYTLKERPVLKAT